MSTTAVVLIIIAVIVVVAIVAWQLFRRERTRKLRSRFGPEYDRTIEQYGEPAKAERDLETRERRMQKANIRSLLPAERETFSGRWQTLQARFVDDPEGTMRAADRLIVEIMTVRGYPMVDFDGRADDLSVDHPLVISHYRKAHDIAVKQEHGAATTEELRQAIVCYRELFDELLERYLVPKA